MIEDITFRLLSDNREAVMERIRRILNNYEEIYSVSLSVCGDVSGGENEILECD